MNQNQNDNEIDPMIIEINELIDKNIQNETTQKTKKRTKQIEENNSPSPFKQSKSFKRRLNLALIYYLLTECKGYKFIHDNVFFLERYFIKLQTISKNKKIIYDFDTIKDTIKGSKMTKIFRREELQIFELIKLLKKEKGIKMTIKSTKNTFDVVEFVYKNKQQINIDEFLEKYYKYDEVVELMNEHKNKYSQNNQMNKETKEKENVNHNENFASTKIEKRKEVTKTNKEEKRKKEKKVNNQLNNQTNSKTTLSNKMNISRVNYCMIYYLLKECKKYNFIFREELSELTPTKFALIHKLYKKDELVFDAEECQEYFSPKTTERVKMQLLKSVQMEKMAGFITNESGIVFEFSKEYKSFELKRLVDKNGKEIDLDEFLDTYDKFYEMMKLIEMRRKDVSDDFDENLDDSESYLSDENDKQKQMSEESEDEESVLDDVNKMSEENDDINLNESESEDEENETTNDSDNESENESESGEEDNENTNDSDDESKDDDNNSNNEEQKINEMENENETENKTKWSFQNPQQIQKILTLENTKNNSHEVEMSIIIRKVTNAMIYYLNETPEDYEINLNNLRKNVKNLMYIESIKKGKRTLFNINKYSKQMKNLKPYKYTLYWRKIQIEELAKIIENETGLKFVFNGDINHLEIVKFVDQNETPLDLYEFVLKYDKTTNEEDEETKLMEEETNQTIQKKKDNKEKDETNCDVKENVENEIKQILTDENVLDKSETSRIFTLLRVINNSLLYYLLSKCERYTFLPSEINTGRQRKNDFIYISKIMKDDIILFNIENHKEQIGKQSRFNEMYLKRSIQLNYLSSIIEKESGMKMKFDDHSVRNFTFESFKDKNDNHLNLYQFVKKYYHYSELIELIDERNKKNKSNNHNENEIIEIESDSENDAMSEENETIEKEMIKPKEESEKENNLKQNKFQWNTIDKSSLNKILSEEKMLKESQYKQRSAIIRKINCCLLYYLLKECNEYKIILHRSRIIQSEFIYVKKIFKGNEIIFDSEKPNDDLKTNKQFSQKHSKRKMQMEKLGEIIENETGMKLKFINSDFDSLELVSFVDKNDKNVDLYEFMKKYEKYKELKDLISDENETYKMEIEELNDDIMNLNNNDENNDENDNETNNVIINNNINDITNENSIHIETNDNKMIEENYEDQLPELPIHLTQSNYTKQTNETNENRDKLIISFNSSLITILNKLHYIVSVIRPESLTSQTKSNETFLYIKTIQKESEKCILYDNSLINKQNNQMMKINQMKQMMKIIENEINSIFLFEIEELFDFNDSQQLKITIVNQIISIDEFIQSYNFH